jgi:autoinducer 2-degrading protein
MIVVVATYQAQAGRGDDVAAAMAEITPQCLGEDGCLMYVGNRSLKDPDHFVLYEQYRDEAAIEAHRQSRHFTEIVLGRIVPMLEVREVDLYELVTGPTLK